MGYSCFPLCLLFISYVHISIALRVTGIDSFVPFIRSFGHNLLSLGLFLYIYFTRMNFGRKRSKEAIAYVIQLCVGATRSLAWTIG